MSHTDGRPPSQSSQQSSSLARSRSNTTTSNKSRRSQLSRASTASVQSVNTQQSRPSEPRQFTYQQSHHHLSQPVAPQQNQQTQLQHNDSYDYSAENMILQSAQHLTNPNGFAIDPALGQQLHAGLPYPADDHFRSHTPQSQAPMGFPRYESVGSQLPDQALSDRMQDTPDPEAEVNDGRKSQKGRSSTSAQNDIELRRLFREAEHSSLQEVALQLQGNERGPQSEKIRQTFAMIWLNTSCSKTSGSVPRGRVYAQYVVRCGNERVTVLNPASFGKLVRVMFPGIQTRRLGMRGESKYHYCGLSLNEDPEKPAGDVKSTSVSRPQSQQRPTSKRMPETSTFHLPTDTTVAAPLNRAKISRKQIKRHQRALSRLYHDSTAVNLDANSKSDSIDRELRFPTSPDVPFSDREPIDLPPIESYVPEGTDSDTSSALVALYRTHCTSLIDCVRYCREKHFFHLFTSFQGNLTVPVQKLLAQPSVASWITQCDWMMYQKMIRVVAPLTLQVVPPGVMNFLRGVSQRLGSHVKSSFHSHPEHVVNARLGPATIFASLLDRLLRVNLTAHAAANMLCNTANRDLMYEEWCAYVQPVKVVESELPASGHKEVLHILNFEIRELLSPVTNAWDSLNDTHAHPPAPESTEGALDRWTSFLGSLQDRFPQADARMIIQILNSVSTSCLRDITMNGGKSFGSWWITKTWLDEMSMWLAEKGGFMEHTPGRLSENDAGIETLEQPIQNFGPRTGSGASSRTESRFSSVSADFNSNTNPYNQNGEGQSTSQKLPSDSDDVALSAQASLAPADSFSKDLDHDDSGIGMRMSDEDVSIGKFDFDPVTGLHAGSDGPSGDVVVC